MVPDKEILKFMENRPETVAIIGYGSGVKPQKGQEKRKPQIDLIIVVDNIKKWHLDNIKINPKDYSFSGKLFFKHASLKKIKAGGKICYMTYISYNGRKYKIGTIEKEDFLNDLKTWETFYLAGRMQKPILVVKAPQDILDAIEYNRHAGVLVTELLNKNQKISKEEFYMQLAGLSYIGDTRMKIAENPDKVMNIVKGNIEFYAENYGSLLKEENGKFIIPKNLKKETLPDELYEYLDKYNGNEKNGIIEFLTQKNKAQSTKQTIKGLFTTGPIKSIKYVSEKIKRRKRK